MPVVIFISLELIRGSPLRSRLIAGLGHRAAIAVLRIEAVIDLAVKIVGAVKPGSRTDEDAGIKPFRAEVAVGSEVIRGVVIPPGRAAETEC